MSNSAVTPVSFSSANFQLKVLSANFSGTTPCTAASDLTFNNMVSGKTYRIIFNSGYSNAAADIWIQYGSGSDNTKYSYFRIPTANLSIQFEKIFISDGTAVKIYLGPSSGTWVATDSANTPTALTGGSPKTTWAILEEMPSSTSTTAYT